MKRGRGELLAQRGAHRPVSRAPTPVPEHYSPSPAIDDYPWVDSLTSFARMTQD